MLDVSSSVFLLLSESLLISETLQAFRTIKDVKNEESEKNLYLLDLIYCIYLPS